MITYDQIKHMANGQDDPQAKLGAVFVATLEELAGEAGGKLGLKSG